MKWEEIGDSVLFDGGFLFHNSFINSYRGLDIVNLRRKLRNYYTNSMQDNIMKYIKSKKVI